MPNQRAILDEVQSTFRALVDVQVDPKQGTATSAADRSETKIDEREIALQESEKRGAAKHAKAENESTLRNFSFIVSAVCGSIFRVAMSK